MTAVSLNMSYRRERRIVLAGLAGITVLSWVYLLAMPMAEMPVADMAMPQHQPWDAAHFTLMLLMWVVMMVAMMVPTASPMILAFNSFHRRRVNQGNTVLPTAIFLAAYVLVWSTFSLGAVLAQWGLHEAGLLSPMMVTTSPVLGGALLMIAGGYQWSGLKDACLNKCRTPLGFLLSEWREGRLGVLIMGLRHAMYCTGCCWALMALLFVGGVMNLLWVSAIAAFVLVEKIVPPRFHMERIAGGCLIIWGGYVLYAAILQI